VTNQGTIGGGIVTLPQPEEVPPITVPSGACTNLGVVTGSQALAANTTYCATSVSIGGGSLIQMFPGSQLIVDPGNAASVAINITGSAMLYAEPTASMNQPVQVFAKRGSIVTNGTFGLVNNDPSNPIPGAFQVYVKDSSSTYGLTLQQAWPFEGVAYAENSSIRALSYNSNTIEITGALQSGKKVEINPNSDFGNSIIHYDVQLRNLRQDGGGVIPSTVARYQIKSWEID
jgi:hypothetical protein